MRYILIAREDGGCNDAADVRLSAIPTPPAAVGDGCSIETNPAAPTHVSDAGNCVLGPETSLGDSNVETLETKPREDCDNRGVSAFWEIGMPATVAGRGSNAGAEADTPTVRGRRREPGAEVRTTCFEFQR